MQLSHNLTPINDNYLKKIKSDWFEQKQKSISCNTFVIQAIPWFLSTQLNLFDGINHYPYVDIIMGCTHYLESLISKYGWNGFQILNDEYAYFKLMGKHGVNFDQLQEGIPLIISLPNWKYGDLRPEWNDILKICEERAIDIHIDMAWITCARDINFSLDHPAIKSFAMSLSKYAMQWNRVGIRWTKQRSMDSITIFNHYYGDVNSGVASCGFHFINNVERDYAWNTYGDKYYKVCAANNLLATKCIQIARKDNEYLPYGVSNLL